MHGNQMTRASHWYLNKQIYTRLLANKIEKNTHTEYTHLDLIWCNVAVQNKQKKIHGEFSVYQDERVQCLILNCQNHDDMKK